MAKRGINGMIMRAYGAQDHEATVTGTEYLAAHFLRVRMVSTTLLREAVIAPTAYLRFWMPDPDDPAVEHQRGYTLSEADPATGEFAVDFVLHEPAGPASLWARRAVPGTTVQVTSLGSTRFDAPEDPPAGYLLIGDAASIPAINAVLSSIPDTVPAEVYLEQHQSEDLEIPLVAHPRANVRWIPRRGERSLAESVEARDWSDWYVWTAPESGSLKHLRARLRDEFGFPRSETHAQAYWYYGRAFGSNRSTAVTESEHDAASVVSDQAQPEPPVANGTEPVRGSWRAQAAGRLIAPLRSQLILSGAGQALVTLVQLAPFVLLVELSRLMITGAEADSLWAVGIWAVALMGIGVVLGAVLLLRSHRVDANFSRTLRQRLLTKLSQLPLGWFDARSSGQVKQIVQDDTLALHYLITHAVPDAVAAVVAPVAVLVYLFCVDWRLALLLLLPVLAYIVAMTIMVVQSGPRTGEALRWSERMNVEAGGYLDGQPVIRVFGGAAASTFRRRLGEYIRFLDDWQRPLSGQKLFIDMVTRPATFLLLICALGTVLITTGSMQPVSLLPFLLLGTTFGARLMGIGYGLSGLRSGLLAARRIQVTLDDAELPVVARSDAAAPKRSGHVDFDDVGFCYRPGVPVLQGISLALAPGTVTALVGPSGSGKSTLAALLARFHDVQEGAIRIDGRDIREMTPDELYARVGFVFQQTQLVQGTVRENIALSDPDASDQAVEAAARAAQIHDRIVRMRDGYDTVLGPDAALSGGERQRLTIARALLADTEVLVLDEATAFADPESEYLVQQALNRLTEGRTVLVIAHRLHTITGVDRIIVLDDGHAVESGTHEELLQRGGRYKALWDADRIRSGRSLPMIRTLLAILPSGSGRSIIVHLCLTVIGVALRAAGAVVLVPLVAALFSGDPTASWPWLAVLAGVTVAGWAVDSAASRRGFGIGFGLLDTGQRTVADRITRIRLTWFDADTTATARQAIAATGPDLVGLIVYLVTPLIGAVLLPLAIAIALVPISVPLGLAALAGVPVLWAAFWIATRLGRDADRAASAANSALTERILEFARTQQALRSARRVEPARSQAGAALAAQHGATMRLLVLQVPGQLVFGLASQLALLLLAGTTVLLTVQGTVTVPEAIALIVVVIRYLEPFTAVAELSPGIEASLGTLRRIRDVLEAPEARSGTARRGAHVAPRIELQGVGFGYGTTDEQRAIDGLDLVLEPGTTTAIVGPSGSGKSTILALIAGLQDPDSGRVLFDGIDAAAFDAQSRQELVTMVFQHPYLFEGSIRDNILVGAPEAAEEDLAQVAHLARLDGLLSRIPDGWETRVGEAGGTLSGGERQRASIARALLKPAPILLVDEATSALDTENEAAITAALVGDPVARTRIIVAHRLGSIRVADRVVFIDAGRIVEDGTGSGVSSTRRAPGGSESRRSDGRRLNPRTPGVQSLAAEYGLSRQHHQPRQNLLAQKREGARPMAGLLLTTCQLCRDSDVIYVATHHNVPPEGFEPPTFGTGNRRSIP
ncbi:hypothetical protein HA402_015703 [Bradysia odoriphaga]|nr:hypothetical protein HA402_015703 [Bradysia odoriphaga]